MKIKVSVIVPVYNVEECLARCLDSLVAQTLKEIEIIIINDGSTDNSYSIMEQYYNKYPDKIKIYKQLNQGLGPTRNNGIQYSTGEYIGFVDSDDYVDVNMFLSLYKDAKRLNCDVAVSPYAKLSLEGKRSIHCQLPLRTGKVYTGNDYLYHCGSTMIVCNKIYRKSFIKDFLFQPMWFEDVAWTPIVMSYAKSLCYVPTPFYQYILREASISNTVNNPRTLQSIDAAYHSLKNYNPESEEYIIYSFAKLLLFQARRRPLYADKYYDVIYNLKEKIKSNKFIKEDKTLSLQLARFISTNEFIPKIIYYSTFGEKELSENELDILNSWNYSLFAQDATLIQLDESNCDINECPFISNCYIKGNYEIVGHYFKLKKIIETGGLGLSLSLIGIKNITPLLTRSDAIFGFRNDKLLCSQIYGSIANQKVVHDLINAIETSIDSNISFEVILEQVLLIQNQLCYDFTLETNFKHKYLEAYNGAVRIYATSVFSYDYKIGFAFSEVGKPISSLLSNNLKEYYEVDAFYYDTLQKLYPLFINYNTARDLKKVAKPLKSEIKILYKQKNELEQMSLFEILKFYIKNLKNK